MSGIGLFSRSRKAGAGLAGLDCRECRMRSVPSLVPSLLRLSCCRLPPRSGAILD